MRGGEAEGGGGASEGEVEGRGKKIERRGGVSIRVRRREMRERQRGGGEVTDARELHLTILDYFLTPLVPPPDGVKNWL